MYHFHRVLELILTKEFPDFNCCIVQVIGRIVKETKSKAIPVTGRGGL
jgi:hypothetical protein